jgi:16S rRNA (guanine966-N2)-methyltransferase
MVKRKLFDWRQRMDEYVFIDLCAGSGGMAFEALSRGAQKIFVNDSMRGAFLTLKENKEGLMKAFKFDDDKIVVHNLEAIKWVERELAFQLPDTENAILYLDPPYEDHKLYTSLLGKLKELEFQGELWVESDRLKGPKLSDVSVLFRSVIKVIEQGDHFVVVGKLV